MVPTKIICTVCDVMDEGKNIHQISTGRQNHTLNAKHIDSNDDLGNTVSTW